MGALFEDRQLDHKAITVKELCARYLADLQAGLILGKGGRPKKASTIVTDTGSQRASHHSAFGDQAGQGSNKDLHQQGPQGHHGREDAGFGQDQEAAAKQSSGGRWNGDTYCWSSRRHPYLRCRSRHHRQQSGPWYPQAKGQCAKASALGGGVSNIESDTPRRRQAGEICYDRRYHSSACSDRLPAERNDRLEMDEGRHRGQLLAVRGQQGGRMHPSDRVACRRISRATAHR